MTEPLSEKGLRLNIGRALGKPGYHTLFVEKDIKATLKAFHKEMHNYILDFEFDNNLELYTYFLGQLKKHFGSLAE